MKPFTTLTALFATLFLHILSPVHAQTQNPLQQALLFTLESNPTSVLGFASSPVDPTTIDRKLLGMYIKNNLHPLWLNENGPGMKAQALLTVLQNSDKDGVNPDDYHIEPMLELWQGRDPVQLASLDVLLTLALGTYVADMREGRADPCLLDPELFASARNKEVDIAQLVEQALAAPDLTTFLMQQSPAHQAYHGLREALAKYRNIADQGGLQTIAAGPTIKPGMEDVRMVLIARRLAITGDLSEIPPGSLLFSEALVAAVKGFQQRFNLEVDGVIGKKTLAAMNIPIQDLLKRIIINMERWRWLPNKLDGRRILVNIAGFQLSGINNEQVEIRMPVIVGKVYHKTPVFSNALRYIVFNPFWNIPTSITVNETLPSQIENPEYLQENHICMLDGWQENAPEVDPAFIDWQTIGKGIKRYRLRQDPGPDNALGSIKFMFPNEHNIYLHDTPAHNLFKKQNRSFSHGCIRVSAPDELAQYLLQEKTETWDAEKIRQVIVSRKRTVVLLNQPVPIHILYRTVRVDLATGKIFFYKDIYGRDALLARALFSKKPAQQCNYPQ